MLNKKFITILSIIIIVSIALSVFLAFRSPQRYKDSPEKPSEKYLEVGNETIYSQDFVFEKTYTPPLKNVDINEFINNKLVYDSIILQEAEKRGVTSLNNTIYNSPTKNYQLRLATIKDINEKVASQSIKLKGVVVSMYFYNYGRVGSLGYEKSKEKAYEKITTIYNALQSNNLTLDEALESMINDPEIADLDLSYKTNVMMPFAVNDNRKIVYDDTFNKMIYSLKSGEYSPIVLLKTTFGHEDKKVEKDTLYAFAYVSESNSATIGSLEQWYEQVKDSYIIKHYD